MASPTPREIAERTLAQQDGKCWRCEEPLDLEMGVTLAAPTFSVVVCHPCYSDEEGTGEALRVAIAERDGVAAAN